MAPRVIGQQGLEAEETLSAADIERELNDPSKEWSIVDDDPDFLLMNGDEQVKRQKFFYDLILSCSTQRFIHPQNNDLCQGQESGFIAFDERRIQVLIERKG